ncbi:flavodoxin family protein [Pseudothermotoga sp.]
MDWMIVYFTRTGNCERIAKKLAEMTAYPAVRMIDNVNWSGFFGFIKAGFYALTGRRTKITVEGKLEADRIVLITPIWAGSITPAAKSFLDHFDPSKVLLVTVSEVTRPQDVYRSLKRKYSLLGVHGFNRQVDEDQAIKELAEKLQRV